jgi:site-specific DNA-methyltransferase (adenine-specific)
MHPEIEQVIAGERRWGLVCGDALEVLPTLPDESVNAIVTDPPFKLSQEYSAVADPDNVVAVSSVWPSAREWCRVAKPGALCALFYDTRILPLALRAMAVAGWKYLRAMTFYRRWGQASLIHGWMATSDFILLFHKPGKSPRYHGAPRHDVYVKAEAESEFSGHPAQKPLDAVEHLVERVCPPEGVILDSYAGSGTTLLACLRTGRKAIGVEQSEEYCRIARRRLERAERDVMAETAFFNGAASQGELFQDKGA